MKQQISSGRADEAEVKATLQSVQMEYDSLQLQIKLAKQALEKRDEILANIQDHSSSDPDFVKMADEMVEEIEILKTTIAQLEEDSTTIAAIRGRMSV